MKKLFVTSLFAVASLVFAMGGTYTRMENKKSASMAEQDFQECAEIRNDCKKEFDSRCCPPEIIVINVEGNRLASGNRQNEVIMNLLRVSDLLTEVHGTEFYRLDGMSIFQNSITVEK